METDELTHRCPAGGERTLKARHYELMRGIDIRFVGRYHAEQARKSLAEQKRHFEENQLCPTCGYPLDNSYPHPDAD
jgi:hypothetical protein